MRRFSPRLFALGFALGAIGAAAVFAASAYGSTGAVTGRGDSTPTASSQTAGQVIHWDPILRRAIAQPTWILGGTREAA
jgi:hypothetical protein